MAMTLMRRKRAPRIGIANAPLAQAQLITHQTPRVTIPQSQTATPAARAAQTDFAGQADGVNTARINVNKAGDIVGGEFGFGSNVQRYDPKKIAWVMGRGASGGSLSTADRAIYDRMMYLRAQKTAQDAANAEDERKRRLDAEEWDRQHGILNQDRIDAENRQFEFEEQRKENELDRLYETLGIKDEFDAKAHDRNVSGQIRLDNIRTQNAIGQYIMKKIADLNGNPNVEELKKQLQNAKGTLLKSLAEKMRGITPSSGSGTPGATGETDLTKAVTPPQPQLQNQPQPQPDQQTQSQSGGTGSVLDDLFDMW